MTCGHEGCNGDHEHHDHPMGDAPMDGGGRDQMPNPNAAGDAPMGDGDTTVNETWVEANTLAGLQQALDDGERRIEALDISPHEHKQVIDLLCAAMRLRKVDGLFLENCAVTDEDLVAIAACIPETFEGLAVKKNGGAASLAGFCALWAKMPASLKKVDFGDNAFSDADVVELLRRVFTLTKLETLYLDGNQLSNMSHLIEALQNCEELAQLDLGDNRIDDAGLDVLTTQLLPKKPSLTQIILGSNPYSSAAATRFALAIADSGVTVLYMDSTAVDDAFLEQAAGSLSGLEELHLDSTKITDEGLKHLLKSLTNMDELDVSGNNISDEMMAALRLSMTGGNKFVSQC